MKLAFSFTIVSLSLVALSCAKTAKPAEPPVRSTPAESGPPPAPAAGGTAYTVDEACTTSVAAITVMGSIAESNTNNCDNMATAYEKFAVDYKSYFDWIRTVDATTKKAFLDTCTAKVQEAMKTVGPQMKMVDPCSSNTRLVNVLKSLQ